MEIWLSAEKDSIKVQEFLKTVPKGTSISKGSLKTKFKIPHVRSGYVWNLLAEKGYENRHDTIFIP